MVRKLALAPLVLAVVVATAGWLYVIRANGLPGPRGRQARPLAGLAKHAAAPLVWFVAVWSVAALVLVALSRWARVDRLSAALLLALATNVLLYLATGGSLAITRQISLRDGLHTAGKLGVAYLPAASVGPIVAASG